MPFAVTLCDDNDDDDSFDDINNDNGAVTKCVFDRERINTGKPPALQTRAFSRKETKT